MGFPVTTLIFAGIGIVASLCTRICFNRGPSANLFHLTLVLTATICCWMICVSVPVLLLYLTMILPCFTRRQKDGKLWLKEMDQNLWAIVYLAQMKPLIVPILSEGE